MNPKAILTNDHRDCFVCGGTTRRLRSMKHLSGPPRDKADSVPICLACDEPWTAGLVREQISNPPTQKP